MKTAVISSSELAECWSPARFTGSECNHIKGCKASCKKTCKAYHDKVVVTKTQIRVKACETV